MSVKPPCVKCELTENSNGLFACNGCRQNFCSNHMTDHFNELRNRFEQIINEYNLVKDIFENYKQKSNDFTWKLIHEKRKEIDKIRLQIDKYQKTSNYSEQELDQCMTKLNNLKVQLTKTNEAHSFIFKCNRFLSSKIFRIRLTFILIILIAYTINSTLKSNVKFSEVIGPIKLSENQHVAEHIGTDDISGSFLINQKYSEGIHHVQLLFEQYSSSNTFIGIIESTSKQSISSSYGWYIGGKQMIYQIPREYQIFSIIRRIFSYLTIQHDIQQGDIIELEIDCINTKIILKNKQTNKKFELNIDLEQTPLPWQIIINFDRHGNRVHLY